MNKLLLFLYTILAISGSHASASWGLKGLEQLGQWAGDRTGLKRPFEEATGLAEEKRTAEARSQAAAAEQEANAANAELQNRQADLRQLQQEFEKFKSEAEAERAQVRRLATPVNAKLFDLNQTSQAMAKSHQELLADSDKISHQLESFNASLAELTSMQGRSPNLLTEEDRALIRVLQISLKDKALSSPQYREGYTSSLDLVTSRGRQLETDLQVSLGRAQNAFNLGHSIVSRSKSIHDDFNQLTSAIKETQSGIQKLTASANQLDQKVTE